jgi:uncharacterized protein
MMAHFTITPGWPGWLDKVDEAIERFKPDSWKGYTIGDNTHKDTSRYPWRMDDEKVAYLGYEKFVKAGIKNVCVHKGLFAPPLDRQFPNLRGYVDASDVGQAAKDWPQLNFIIYHGAYRHVGGDPKVALAEFERTGRISWTSDLADIPETYNVTNVYADVGQLFAMTLIAEPRVTAALMGTMIKKMGLTESAGARMRYGPVRRNGRSKDCAGSRSPKTCRSNTASPPSARPMGRSKVRSSG